MSEAAHYEQPERENASWQDPDPEDDRWAQAQSAQAHEGWPQDEAGSAADAPGAGVWNGSPDRDWQEPGMYAVPVADADAPTGEIPVVEDEAPAPIVNAHEPSEPTGPVDDEVPTGSVRVVNADARPLDDEVPTGPVPVVNAGARPVDDDVPTGSVPVVANGFPRADEDEVPTGYPVADDDVPTGSVPVVAANGFSDADDDTPTGSVPVVAANSFADDDTPTGAVPVVDARDQAPPPDDDDVPTGVVPVVSVDGNPQESNGAPNGVGPAVGVPAARIIERMSIPGLALAGSDGPGIEVVPGSIEEALRAEVERPRPRPRESEAFEALHAWCRARTAIVPSGFTIQVQVLDPAAPSYRFDLEPPDVDDPEFAADKLSGLLGDLWVTESESELGGWLFARIDAAGRTMRVDRWYDRVPDWWDNPVEPRLDVNGLVRRLYGRGPQWQPSYLERLYTSAR